MQPENRNQDSNPGLCDFKVHVLRTLGTLHGFEYIKMNKK